MSRQSSTAVTPRRPCGFTLVELLVVIGIIALLISILLPSLGRARMAASNLRCQSNLRSMWQAVTIYASQNRDLAPFGQVTGIVNNGVETPFGFSAPNDYPWSWTDTISLMLGSTPSQLASNRPAQNSGVFDDKDANVPYYYVPAAFSPGPMVYTAHPKIFTRTSFTNPVTGGLYKQRALGTIRKPAEVMAIWDSSQLINTPFQMTSNSIPLAERIDADSFYARHGMQFPTPLDPTFTPDRYQERIAIGLNPGNTLTELKVRNTDGFGYTNQMRFRHFDNTSANFCFADGHVESRKLGDVRVRDICLNPK